VIATACPAALTVARNGDAGADIRLGLAAQWRERGADVQLVGSCTFESSAYFSHRRDGITGRQAGVVAWLP
jgi:copper oxidase (laccase) domain-containing protein